MIEKLQTQLNFIPALTSDKQKPVVCVEAGHIYTDESPTIRHEIGAIVGKNVSNILEGLGVQVQRMLFVDDYHPTTHSLDLDSYQKLLAERGFVADKVVMESSLNDAAEDVITLLQDKSLIDVKKNGAIILKKTHKKEKDIVLRKSPEMGGAPACAALDTALYLKKSESTGVCVTILHDEWKEQQSGVKKVLKALGKDIPILEVYYSDYGDIEVDFDY